MQRETGGNADCDTGTDWDALASTARAAAHTGLYCWDIASGRVYWDEVMRQIFGSPFHASLPFAAFLEQVHPDDRERVQAEFEAAIGARRDSRLTFRIRRPDGQERILLGSGRVECLAEARTLRMVGSATDLTGQMNHLIPQVAEYRFLRTVLTHTPDIVSLFDPQFRHLYVSPAIEKITGRPASAFIGKTNEELGMPAENCREWRSVMNKAAQTGQPTAMGFSIPDQNGAVRHFEARIVPVYEPDGELVSLVSIVSDVSDHARTVNELREKQERLTAADRFKDVFISVLAHELRNPLAPIRSALDVLRLTRQEAVVDRTCEIIERQTAQLVNLVDDLLDLSRVREGKFNLRLQDMDVAAALQTAIEAVEPFFREKHQSLTQDIPAQPLPVKGDPTRIVQVFVNLLCNASKFSAPHGQVRLQAAREDRMLVVTICDNGVGMSPTQLGKLFTLFHQHDHAGDRASGLGIGLTLVRQIVEAHAGTVSGSSAGLGEGSSFTVSLPLSA